MYARTDTRARRHALTRTHRHDAGKPSVQPVPHAVAARHDVVGHDGQHRLHHERPQQNVTASVVVESHQAREEEEAPAASRPHRTLRPPGQARLAEFRSHVANVQVRRAPEQREEEEQEEEEDGDGGHVFFFLQP